MSELKDESYLPKCSCSAQMCLQLRIDDDDDEDYDDDDDDESDDNEGYVVILYFDMLWWCVISYNTISCDEMYLVQ